MQYEKIIKKMSLEDKIKLCSGKDFWHTKDFKEYGIPSIMMTDGPHGLRKQNADADMLGIHDAIPTTCFPTAVTMGATWDRKLIAKVAEAIGEEAQAEDVPVVLGPGVNIKRNPLCGRNFEYFSEDPYLSGEMGAAYVNGMQKTGIGTSLKHFAVNSQEYKRFSSDSQIDERTLREIYLSAFERVVKQAQPKTVMCAYPKLNGTYCSDNKILLTDILRKEWGFQGMVVTDWGGMNNRMESFKAGCDLSMPGGSDYGEREALEAVKTGKLSEEDINRSVNRILTVVMEGQEVLDTKGNSSYDIEKHQKLAAKAASEGAVLLKNSDNILPLKKGNKVVLIGHMAKQIRYQGSGSSHINPTKLIQVTDVMKEAVYLEACNEKGIISEKQLEEVEEFAKNSDITIVFAGLTDQYESEGFDRDNMNMPEGHNQMIEAAVKGNPNTIVVLMGGSPMLLPWFDKVKAILYMGLCGQSGGQAISDILAGEINPSGKLTETWPLKEKDVPSYGFYAGNHKNAQYREGIYVGYRYYEKADIPVRFPFGYGLSYTSFQYTSLSVEAISDNIASEKKNHFLEKPRYHVNVSITNTGVVPGAEVVQLYVEAPQDGIYRAVKELKGFEKVYLEPGETKEVIFNLDDRSFAIYQGGWKVPEGKYIIMVGASIEDIRLSEKIKVIGVEDDNKTIRSKDVFINLPSNSKIKIPDWQKGSWYEKPTNQPSKLEWEKLMGKKIDEDSELKKGKFEINNTLMELKDYNFIAKFMVGTIEKKIAKDMGIKVDYTNPEFRMSVASSVDCSMRGMIISSCGQFPKKLAECIVEIANGHPFKGIGKMIGR